MLITSAYRATDAVNFTLEGEAVQHTVVFPVISHFQGEEIFSANTVDGSFSTLKSYKGLMAANALISADGTLPVTDDAEVKFRMTLEKRPSGGEFALDTYRTTLWTAHPSGLALPVGLDIQLTRIIQLDPSQEYRLVLHTSRVGDWSGVAWSAHNSHADFVLEELEDLSAPEHV